jgi:hypothetical protein
MGEQARPAPKMAARVRKEDFNQERSHLIEGCSFSPQEFYARVELALQRRQVPEMKPSRVLWREKGPLSAKREYLRLERDRLSFDVCAMPFGTGFYVSEWCGEQPQPFPFAPLVLAVGAPFFCQFIGVTFRPDVNLFLLFIGLELTALIWAITVRDAFLMRIPVVKLLYAKYIRKITFYQQDTISAYMAAVDAAVCEVMDELTNEQGIPSPSTDMNRRPVNRDLDGKARRHSNPASPAVDGAL